MLLLTVCSHYKHLQCIARAYSTLKDRCITKRERGGTRRLQIPIVVGAKLKRAGLRVLLHTPVQSNVWKEKESTRVWGSV